MILVGFGFGLIDDRIDRLSRTAMQLRVFPMYAGLPAEDQVKVPSTRQIDISVCTMMQHDWSSHNSEMLRLRP